MTAAHSIKIYLSVKIIDFLFACYDALCTGFASICISRKRRAHVMRGFDPIARGMKRSDLTPMKLREYRGLLLNSSESISFLYATRIPNTVIGIDHFGTRTWPTHGFLSGRCLVMSSANPIGKTVVPSNLQPLEQVTKTILEAARLCGFRNLSKVPRKYHEHLSSAGI